MSYLDLTTPPRAKCLLTDKEKTNENSNGMFLNKYHAHTYTIHIAEKPVYIFLANSFTNVLKGVAIDASLEEIEWVNNQKHLFLGECFRTQFEILDGKLLHWGDSADPDVISVNNTLKNVLPKAAIREPGRKNSITSSWNWLSH
jgi:hypothetical protein